jgi:hypothetical protein
MNTNNSLSTVIEVGGQQLTITNEKNIVVVTTSEGKQFRSDAWKEGYEPTDEEDLLRMLWEECGAIYEGEQFQGKFDEWYDYAGYAGWDDVSDEDAHREFDRSCRLAREWHDATNIPAETLMQDFFNIHDF